MTSSLYDKYHSEQNSTHIYTLLKQIMYDNMNIILTTDDYNIYRNIKNNR